MVIKLLHLNLDTGLINRTQDGAIVNIGGVVNSTFTVNGRGLLYDDGTSTAGTAAISLSLQAIYNNSPNVSGSAQIKLTTGKDFSILDDTDDSVYFRIDAETGKVTITGDLEVFGNSSIIESTITDFDHQRLTPASGVVAALHIEPENFVTPLVDLVLIRGLHGESIPSLRIDRFGNTFIRNLSVLSNLSVSGTINGVDIEQLAADVADHVGTGTVLKHAASEISVENTAPLTSLTPPSLTDVQQTLELLNQKIDTTAASSANSHVHLQGAFDAVWTIQHNKNSRNFQFSIWDQVEVAIIPDQVFVVNENQIKVYFGSPQSGKVVLTFLGVTTTSAEGVFDPDANPPIPPVPTFVHSINGLYGDVTLSTLVGPQGPIGPQGPQGPAGNDGAQGPAGSAASFQAQISFLDEPSGNFTIGHGLNKKFNLIQVYDDQDEVVIPNTVKAISDTSCSIYLNPSLFNYSQTFTVVIIAGAF